MSLAITADEPPLSLPRRFVDLLPGLALLFAIAFSGKLIEQTINGYGKAHHLALPNIEYVLWAIVIGRIVANTIGVPKIFRAGIQTYEFFLKLGIVLLGVRFLLGDVLKLGGISLIAVVLELTISIVLMTWLGNTFKLTPKLTSLLAIGSSICGVSEIRPRLHRGVARRDARRVLEGAGGRHREPVALGVPSDLCGRRPVDRLSRDAQTGPLPLYRGRRGRDRDRDRDARHRDRGAALASGLRVAS